MARVSERWRDPAGTPGADGYAQVGRRGQGGLGQGPGGGFAVWAWGACPA